MSDKQANWLVLKFGGTSVSTLKNWRNIQSIIRQRKSEGFSICVVHSALSGISDKLQQIINQAPDGSADKMVEAVKSRHRKLGKELKVPVDELLKKDFSELEKVVKGIELIGEADYRVQARLLAMGELMATKLGAAYLKQEFEQAVWLDARKIIKAVKQKNASEKADILSAVSSDDFNPGVLETLNNAGDLIVTQGFIGSDSANKTVLLGRGGSDASAAYLAAKIKAACLEIWTDVPGMFSANPSMVSSARLLNRLSYGEAQEIAASGAKVLHPLSIAPARKHKIPIHVKCVLKPELQGTVISADAPDDEALIKAIAVRHDVILISMESLGMWQQIGFLADAFEVFKRYGLSIDLVSTSESNVTASLDPGLNTHFEDVRKEFVDELENHCKVEVIESVSAVSLLGRRIRTILHQLGSAFEVFQEHQIYLVSQAANDLNFTFVVERKQADRLVRQLHEQVISQSGNQQSYGPTWPELMGEKKPEMPDDHAWWKNKREKLLDLVEESGFCYVYDEKTLQEYGKMIQDLEAIDQALYAIKANANADVLRTFKKLGFGFECVSIGEVEKVLELFPKIDRKKILFTPNFAPKQEYEKALDLNINLTLDNIYPLKKWPNVFKGRELFLRIDPGHGQGHHKHVKTGGVHSKFGIPRFEIPEIIEIVDQLDINVKGLHAHIGSGIKDSLSWKTTAIILQEVAEELGGVEILDLGGGFGIRENETQAHLDMKQIDQSLKEFKEAYPDYRLWVEPGRFLVAAAGVLLTKVTQLKGKGTVRYVGVDTGMNSFIRPALYGAHHTIVNLSKMDQPANQTVNIVGPICESGDKLGINRLLPDSEEGDVILVANTGAYGQVMSTSYNLRPPAKDIFLD
ncbi:MAG TPA: bifunctional aspartate kinase/diaminopimelate decarboxylase [Balneolaceae bacterium]